MDRQLRDVLDILNDSGLRYWLDSGTLLHLMRDNYLPGHDEDLDINIWEEELPLLEDVFPVLKGLGYVIYSFAYKGMIFKYNCTISKGKTPGYSDKPRVVDINIYRKAGDIAWCPLYYFKVNPSKEKPGARDKGFTGKARGIIRGTWKKLNTVFPLDVDVGNFPWRNFVNLGTWQIPKHFFENIIYDDELGAYIPAPWEEYLSFRYGKWEKPLRHWVFYRDDGGVRDELPEDIT